MTNNKEQLTRNLTILFGFFFVILSSMVVTSQYVDTENLLQLGVIYLLAVGIAIGGSMVGIELIQLYMAAGISPVGTWGVGMLVVVIPGFYIFGIGVLLGLGLIHWLGAGTLYLFALLFPYLMDYYKEKTSGDSTS